MSWVRRSLGAFDAAVLRPVAGLALLTMMLAIALNAFTRGFFNVAVGWVIPFVTSLAMPAVVFFGLPSLTLADGHVRMEAVSGRLSATVQRLLRRLGFLIGILVLGYIGYANAMTAWDRRDQGTTADAVVPGWFQYGMVSFSCFLTVLVLLLYLTRPGLIRGHDPVDDAATGEF